jgi:hypothetical protein
MGPRGEGKERSEQGDRKSRENARTRGVSRDFLASWWAGGAARRVAQLDPPPTDPPLAHPPRHFQRGALYVLVPSRLTLYSSSQNLRADRVSTRRLYRVSAHTKRGTTRTARAVRLVKSPLSAPSAVSLWVRGEVRLGRMRSKCARLLAIVITTIVRELDVAVRKTAMTAVSYPSWSTLDDGSTASQTEDVLSGSIKGC